MYAEVNLLTVLLCLMMDTGLRDSHGFDPQFQSFKLPLRHALQSHRCGQIQGGNVLHFAAVCYLATEFLYFWVSANFQKHFIRIGDGRSFQSSHA